MQRALRISKSVRDLLRCPVCHAHLEESEGQLVCMNSSCGARFPVVDGAPILINAEASLFSITDLISQQRASSDEAGRAKLAGFVYRLIPSISGNIRAKKNFNRFSEILFCRSASPRILVIGGGVLGQGMESLARDKRIELVESDVAFSPRTAMICDAHEIPFEDESFDGVIAQAVLEHVVDPQRCCEEIHRVLKTEGVVYAETPFIQQVHRGEYDFTRFTHLGHRRLFRRFEEIASGAVCGPGMALAWSYRYFLLSFTRSTKLRAFLKIFADLTSFHLKYFDHFLADTPGAMDAASGFFFMGNKSDSMLSDRDLIQLYRGAERTKKSA